MDNPYPPFSRQHITGACDCPRINCHPVVFNIRWLVYQVAELQHGQQIMRYPDSGLLPLDSEPGNSFSHGRQRMPEPLSFVLEPASTSLRDRGGYGSTVHTVPTTALGYLGLFERVRFSHLEDV